LQEARSSRNVDGGSYAHDMGSAAPLEFGRVLHGAETRTGFALTTLGGDFARRIREVLADRGPIGQRELATLMGIDHSVLVNLLNPLEAARLVKRERDSVDRRRHVVTIAAAGLRRLEKADAAFRTAEDAFLAPLSTQQRDQLHELLSLLRDATFARAADDDAC
jgi:DNA-binding MarR family transcriptional regulator